MPTPVVLLRHGQASFGAVDYDVLSETGRRQATRLGEALRGRFERVAAVVSGTMRRQRDTAATCLAAMQLEAPRTEDPAWNEFDHEDVIRAYDPRFSDHALFHRELATHPAPAERFDETFHAAVARWTSGTHDAEYRESWPAFLARVDGALERLPRTPGGAILVFTSGGPISAACRAHLGAADAAAVLAHAFRVANASVTTLEALSDGRVLKSFNDHAHVRDVDGLLTFR